MSLSVRTGMFRVISLAMCMTVAYSSCALGVNTAAYSLGSAIQRFLQIRPGPFTDRPLPIKRGPNPKRDPVLRGGKFTPRTLKDLEAAALNRRLHWYGAQMWTSLALEPMAWLQGAPGGGDPGGGDPGGGEGGTGTGGSGSGGSGGAGGGSAGGGSTGTGNTNVGNQLHSLPIVSWKAKGQTGIGLTLFHNSFGTYVGPWGESWSSSYDTDLTYTSGSSAIIRWGDGTNDAYTESSGTFTPPTGVHDSLV